ncbi:MAG: TonB-dependent receptor, partial [Bryobacteraceae bacterium]|nr:TonB-dependent receptor [Bryobacteraceae bacterium]
MRVVLVPCLLSVLIPLTAAAQTATIDGTVTDATGAAVPRAVVSLHDLQKRQITRSESNASGAYLLPGVSVGSYTLRTEREGFAPASQSLEVTTIGNIRADVQLAVIGGKTSVTVTESPGYQVATSSTAGRMEMKLLEIPQTVQVIPRQLLEDRQVVRFEEALRSSSGAYVSSRHGGQQPFLNFRGFSGTDQMRDGIREYFGYYTMEMANVEQVEVLKGPSSVLFGHLEPGGVVNVVTRHPSASPLASLQLDRGSFGLWRPVFDLSGPLNRSRSLLGRVTGSYVSDEGFRDFAFVRRSFIAPTLVWRLASRTSVTAAFEGASERSSYDGGVPALGDRPAPIPINRSFSEPFQRASSVNARGRLRLDHTFSNGWLWRTTFQKQYARYWRDRGVLGSALNPATGIMSRTFTVGDFANPGIHAQSDLAGFASTGSIRHAWVVGGDFFSRTSLYKSTVPVPYELVNIFIPTSNPAPIPAPSSLAFYNDPQEKFGGVFLQDQLTLGRLQILAGMRINVYRRDYTNRMNG